MSDPTYYLRLRSLKVIGSIALPVTTLVAAKALGASWKEAMTDTAKKFTLEITDEKGVTQWTL